MALSDERGYWETTSTSHEDRYTDRMRDLLSLRLGNLLLPTTIRSQDRRAHYTRWLERFILDPLRPANADLIKKTLTEVCDGISAFENDQEMYGKSFFGAVAEGCS